MQAAPNANLLFGGNGAQQQPWIRLDDPQTMSLTEQEIEMAQTIKAAIDLDDELKPLSDFEVVQYALTHATSAESSSLSNVLFHISRMQAFKELYNVDDTTEEAVACMHAVNMEQPGLFLATHYLETSGNCISVTDWAKYFPRRLTTFEQQARFFKAFYYRFQAMNCTFMAMRVGMSGLVECEGASWENFDWKLQEKMAEELYVSFPKNHKESYYVNSPTVINVAFGLWKRYMTQNMKQALHLGYQVEGMEDRRMDELFAVPNPEAARQNMVENTRHLLQVRFHHQATFALPPIHSVEEVLHSW